VLRTDSIPVSRTTSDLRKRRFGAVSKTYPRQSPPPELPLTRYWREREQIAAAQKRWATDIVDLDAETS
jgi:hypothetical protein